jgi:2-C-methyl-D-erythritol 4-phosphate cytidylyltransferase/2-C-methyl-D-erythritol 2,4-cyclodiphosphate synthase
MAFSAVVVAAGAGLRAGPGDAKQWRSLGGKPLIRWSVEALLASGARSVVAVIPAGEEALAAAALEGLKGWVTAPGGASRAASVVAGLAALDAQADEVVLVHDAARPFVRGEHVAALIAALEGADGAAPALAVADTLKRLAGAGSASTAPREGLWRAQTPQAFRLGALAAAYDAWRPGQTPTDDAAVVEAAGGRVVLIPGDPMLMKLTWPEDFAMAQKLLAGSRTVRIGQGFDAHRFGPGDGVWLCGVRIAHTAGLVGHSDADAGLHALTDALLGAIAAGDIGDHFPPTDERWKGVSSDRFLLHAVSLVAGEGGRVSNVDVTLICEAPKINPHRRAMRARMAELLGVDIARVSVKATTTEGMGFAGRAEGIAAQAVAMVDLPG